MTTNLIGVIGPTIPAGYGLKNPVRFDVLDARIGDDIHALSRSVFDGDVKVICDVKVLTRRIVVAGGDGDWRPVGSVSKVDTGDFAGSSVLDLDLGRAKIVVEQLSIGGVT